MSVRSRVAIAVSITLLLYGAVIAYGVSRLRKWDELGITGLSYIGEMPRQKTSIPGFSTGMVFILYPGGPAERAGLKPRDLLISIQGIPLAEQQKLAALDRRVRTGDTITYRFTRGEREMTVPVRLTSPLDIGLYVFGISIAAFVGLTFAAIGLFVLLRKPDDRRVVVFYTMIVVGGLSLLSGPAIQLEASNMRGIHVEAPGASLVPYAAFLTIVVAFLPLTLHLALVFPRERPILHTSPRLLRWVYGVPAAAVISILLAMALGIVAASLKDEPRWLGITLNVAAALVTLAGLVLALIIARRGRTEGVRNAFWQRPLQSIFVAVAIILGIGRIIDALGIRWLAFGFGIGVGLLITAGLIGFPVLSCITLYRQYRDAGPEERRQVKWPLWGTIIALSMRITVSLVGQGAVAALLLSGSDFGGWLEVASIAEMMTTLVYLLIPISFAVAIFKYRLMNIDIIIRKTVVYAMLSAAIVVLYLGLVGVLGMILVNVAGVKNQTMIIGATLVVALVFVPMRNKLQTLVDRNLFRHKYDYPEALRAISGEALAATNSGAFLTSAAEKTQQALQNRAVVIFSARHDDFVAAAKVGVADSFVGTLRVARPALIPFLERPFDPRRHSLPDDAAAALKRIEASLVVPINAPATPPNGFLALAPKLSGAEFDVEDIDFLRSIADQVDVGIDRIRLQREDADYSQAREIQQSLLPREMPKVAGLDVSGVWQSARTMGGDYFDVLKLSETELAICIGDVAGKGMPAALLMSGLQAAVRASASNSPRDLCERVRRVVVSSLSGGRFVTFFYATIDTAAMRLRWSNAGHNAPILARADGSMVRLSEGGPAISRLFRNTPYEERELPLGPGDRLVLFTDGVSEASDRNGEQFGEHRIEQLAAAAGDTTAEQLQQTIVSTAAAFSNGEMEDDVTLVVVRVTPTHPHPSDQ